LTVAPSILPKKFQGVDVRSYEKKKEEYASGLKIAVLDTGLCDELRSLLNCKPVLFNFVMRNSSESTVVHDQHGLGTHIFGIIIRLVPDDTQYLIGKISDAGRIFLDDLHTAISWALQNGANVICVACAPTKPLSKTLDSHYQRLVEEAGKSVICVAAGNQNVCNWPDWMLKDKSFRVVGSKCLLKVPSVVNLKNATWSSYCCTDKNLYVSHGEGLISHRSKSLHKDLKPFNLDNFSVKPCLAQNGGLVLNGTSQATAFFQHFMLFVWKISKNLH